jgi:cytochrome P450
MEARMLAVDRSPALPTVEPAEAPLPVAKFLPAFIRNPLATLPRGCYEQPVLIQRNRVRDTAYISDPDLVQRFLLDGSAEFPKSPLEKRVFGATLGDGILTAQGASWKWQRRTAAPLFRPGDIAALVPAMVREADAQLARWRETGAGVLPVDRDMAETTFRVISATMFSHQADAQGRTIQDCADTMLRWIAWEIGFGIVGLPTWVWHPGKWPRARAARRMRAAVHEILAARRARDGIAGDDLMARLAAAKDPETGAPMSDEQIVDNMLTFLAAGHETTAKALTWTLYLLAREPGWQDRVRAEVTAVCGDAPITAAHLDKLPLTRQVVKEGMRLYPPVAVMTRMVVAETRIGEEALSPGAILVFPIYAIHRHKLLWKTPDQFDPTHFAPQAEAKHKRAQFMPFGFGPRLCIGMAFAMMEAQALLATLVRGARFDWDGTLAPEPVSRVTLSPRGGMPLAVTPLA